MNEGIKGAASTSGAGRGGKSLSPLAFAVQGRWKSPFGLCVAGRRGPRQVFGDGDGDVPEVGGDGSQLARRPGPAPWSQDPSSSSFLWWILGRRSLLNDLILLGLEASG